jgi:hypothetical protein
MIPSQEEISVGRKAYQGLKAYERFRASQRSKLSVLLNVVAVLFLFMQILVGILGHQYWKVALAAGTVLILLWGCRRMEATKRKHFELLKQLKAKFGPEIYDEIKKEPASTQYKFFQKPYPPDRRPLSVELP